MVKYSKLPRTTSIWNKYIQKNEIDSTQDVTPKKTDDIQKGNNNDYILTPISSKLDEIFKRNW